MVQPAGRLGDDIQQLVDLERLLDHGEEVGFARPLARPLLRLLHIQVMGREHHDGDVTRSMVEPGCAVPGAILRAWDAVEQDAVRFQLADRAPK
jgi:hypothetical protein